MTARARRAAPAPRAASAPRTASAVTAPRVTAVGLAALAALAAVVAFAAPAGATGYRFWAFWQHTGAGWTYATTGPAGTVPPDGALEGWRFGVSPDSAHALKPRGPASFAAICARVPVTAGHVRVALVVDYGTAPGAPRERSACASVPSGASAADALAAVARPLRYDGAGLLCGVAGYPATGCGEPASAPAPAADSRAADGSSTPAGLYAGLGAAVVLGGAAAWNARRRRQR